MRVLRLVSVVLLLQLALAVPARADATAFLGATTTPSNRTVKGFAIGTGLLVIGFEFEFAQTSEDAADGAPSLRTGMGNVLLQTPVALAGFQPYFTVGTGVYRERLDDRQETNVGFNTGGGVKVNLAGPLRARVDYRVFSLRGDPLYGVVHRIYAGINLRF